MDKRSEPRCAVDETVAITTLGSSSFRQRGWVKNVSANGLGVLVKTEIPAGTAVRVDCEDAILLGEAMFCRSMEEGYFVGVQLEQILKGLSELHRQFREFREERVGPLRPGS
jgi:hypothetical protein